MADIALPPIMDGLLKKRPSVLLRARSTLVRPSLLVSFKPPPLPIKQPENKRGNRRASILTKLVSIIDFIEPNVNDIIEKELPARKSRSQIKDEYESIHDDISRILKKFSKAKEEPEKKKKQEKVHHHERLGGPPEIRKLNIQATTESIPKYEEGYFQSSFKLVRIDEAELEKEKVKHEEDLRQRELRKQETISSTVIRLLESGAAKRFDSFIPKSYLRILHDRTSFHPRLKWILSIFKIISVIRALKATLQNSADRSDNSLSSQLKEFNAQSESLNTANVLFKVLMHRYKECF
jgi:hypothetical protein